MDEIQATPQELEASQKGNWKTINTSIMEVQESSSGQTTAREHESYGQLSYEISATSGADIEAAKRRAKTHKRYNHRDFMGRTQLVTEGTKNDRYLKPRDGKLAELTVQSCGLDVEREPKFDFIWRFLKWRKYPINRKPPTSNRSWYQVSIENKTPWVIQFVYWLYPELVRKEVGSEDQDVPSDVGDLKFWERYEVLRLLQQGLKWILTCICITFLLFIPMSLDRELRNNGFYDPVRYRYWGYPKEARNIQERRPETTQGPARRRQAVQLAPTSANSSGVELRAAHATETTGTSGQMNVEVDKKFDGEDEEYDNLPERHLLPRYLCVLRDKMPTRDSPVECIADQWPDERPVDPDLEDPKLNRNEHSSLSPGQSFRGFNKVHVKTMIAEFGEKAPLEYVIVSYTREHFQTANAGALEKHGKSRGEIAELLRIRQVDQKNLFRLAERAARDAGVSAFYLDFMCMDSHYYKQDVNRICDAVRGAHSLVIALNTPVNERKKSQPAGRTAPQDYNAGLKEWGARIWTVPEVLLCSSKPGIRIYEQSNVTFPRKIEKRNFASEAWEDSKRMRQLIDHYEGNLILQPLELVTIGLECLQARLTQMINTKGYKTHSEGDVAYALMGLMRRRPKPNYGDSDFDAIAKLSLANDTNRLLERLICFLPLDKDDPWHKMEDAWKAKFWDIEPRCQISGIAENQTVILDQAYGATIRWKSLAPVAFMKRRTVTRMILQFGLRLSPMFFLIGVTTIATGVKAQKQEASFGFSVPGTTNLSLIIGIVFFLIAMAFILPSPYLLLLTYQGKFWGTQASFFGIEGRADLKVVEAYLFGFYDGRLKWSTNGNLLSQHKPNDNDECEPLDPLQGSPTNIRAENAGQNAQSDNDSASTTATRIFTLVDTFTMTATLIEAEHPPVAVMICGSEGGMQRAVLCSYDWETQTFCRETVLRVKTMVLDRMFCVDRFKFSLRSLAGSRRARKEEVIENEKQ